MEDKASACKVYFSSLQMNMCFSMIVSSLFEEGSSSGKEIEVVIGGSPMEPKRKKINTEEVIVILEEKEKKEKSLLRYDSFDLDEVCSMLDEGDMKMIGEMWYAWSLVSRLRIDDALVDYLLKKGITI